MNFLKNTLNTLNTLFVCYILLSSKQPGLILGEVGHFLANGF